MARLNTITWPSGRARALTPIAEPWRGHGRTPCCAVGRHTPCRPSNARAGPPQLHVHQSQRECLPLTRCLCKADEAQWSDSICCHRPAAGGIAGMQRCARHIGLALVSVNIFLSMFPRVAELQRHLGRCGFVHRLQPSGRLARLTDANGGSR